MVHALVVALASSLLLAPVDLAGIDLTTPEGAPAPLLPENADRPTAAFFFGISWCEASRHGAEPLRELIAAHGDVVHVVAVACGDPVERAVAFMKEERLVAPLLLDPRQRSLERLGIRGLPHLVVFDRRGEVVYDGHPARRDEVQAALARALAPDGAFAERAYVTLEEGRGVAVLDARTLARLATVETGLKPFGVAIEPLGARAYVTDGVAGGSLAVLDTRTNAVVARVPLGAEPHQPAIVGRRLFVPLHAEAAVGVVDLDALVLEKKIAVPAWPHLARESGDGRVFVTCREGPGWLVSIDAAKLEVERKLPLLAVPRVPLPHAKRGLVYVTAHWLAGPLVVGTQGGPQGVLATGADPYAPEGKIAEGLALAGDRTLLVGLEQAGEVALVDLESKAVAARVAVGRNPYWIEVSADGRTAFVSLAGEGKLAAVDLATREVRKVDVGPKPKRLAVGTVRVK